MSNVIIIEAIIILIILFVCFVFSKLYRKYKHSYEYEHSKLEGLEAEYERLLEIYNIQKKNREEADEKINNLHDGNVIDNAIDILRK